MSTTILRDCSKNIPYLVADSSVSPQGLKWAVDPVADVVTTAGDLLYATAADTVARLGIGTAGQVLKVNSGATAPEWGAAAGGSNVIIHYAAPTNNFTSSSASLVDITGLTLTFTPTSATNNIIIIADITCDYDGQGNFRLDLDGTEQCKRFFRTDQNASTSEQLIFRTNNLSASSHTYKLTTNPGGSSITVYGTSSGLVSNLTILEIY